MPAGSQATELETTLRHLAGDRSASGESRAIATDLLALLPALIALRKQGHGELVAKVQNSKVVHGSARFDWKVET